MAKDHHFDPEVAELIGLHEAIILKNLDFWIDKNKANRKHFYKNLYWAYNSVTAFTEQYSYMTNKVIRVSIDNLVTYGIVLKCRISEDKGNVLFYSISDFGYKIINNDYNAKKELGKFILKYEEFLSEVRAENRLIPKPKVSKFAHMGKQVFPHGQTGFPTEANSLYIYNSIHIEDPYRKLHIENSGTEKTEINSSDDDNQAELETEKDFSKEGTEFVFKDIAVYYCPETGEVLQQDNCEVEHLYVREEQIIPQTKQKKLQVKKKGSGANLEKIKKQNCKRVSVKDLDANLDCVKIVNLYNSLSEDQPTQTIKTFSESLASEINGMIELYGFDRYYSAVKLLLEDTSFKSSRYLYPYTPKNILVDKKDRLEKFVDLNEAEMALQASLVGRYTQFCSEYEKVMGKTYSTKNEISEARLLYFELNEEEKEKALKMLTAVMYHKVMKMNEYLKLKIFMYDKGERTKILGVGSSPFEYCNQY